MFKAALLKVPKILIIYIKRAINFPNYEWYHKQLERFPQNFHPILNWAQEKDLTRSNLRKFVLTGRRSELKILFAINQMFMRFKRNLLCVLIWAHKNELKQDLKFRKVYFEKLKQTQHWKCYYIKNGCNKFHDTWFLY